MSDKCSVYNLSQGGPAKYANICALDPVGVRLGGGPPKFEICIILLGPTMSGGPPLICLHTLCKIGWASPDFVTPWKEQYIGLSDVA